MAATIFDVTPELLKSSADKVEGKSSEFKNAYEGIYTATGDLRMKFQGQSSEAFNKRIEEYRNDFQAVEKALNNYIQFVRDYAAKMEKAEAEAVSKANALSSGQ